MKYEASILAVASSSDEGNPIFLSKSISNNLPIRKWSPLISSEYKKSDGICKSCILGNYLYVFSIDSKKLTYCLYDGNNWSSWHHIEGLPNEKYSIIEAVALHGEIHLFCTTDNARLCITKYDGKSWRENSISTKIPPLTSAINSSVTVESGEVKIFYSFGGKLYQLRSSEKYAESSYIFDSDGQTINCLKISASFSPPLQATILACDQSIYILPKKGTAYRLSDEEFLGGTIAASPILQKYGNDSVAVFYSGDGYGIWEYLILKGKIVRSVQESPNFNSNIPQLHFAWVDLRS